MRIATFIIKHPAGIDPDTGRQDTELVVSPDRIEIRHGSIVIDGTDYFIPTDSDAAEKELAAAMVEDPQ